MKKYYLSVSAIFLLTVPWFIGAPFEWMVWVPVVFLGLIYIPASYEAAIAEESILKGIFFPIKVILLLLFLFALWALIIGMVGSFLTLPLTFNQEGVVVIRFLHFFKAFEQSPFSFLLWNFASLNAVIYLWAELEDRKKEVEEKEDLEPDVEE